MLPLCLELVPVCASQHPASPGPRPCARPFVSLWISGIIYFSKNTQPSSYITLTLSSLLLGLAGSISMTCSGLNEVGCRRKSYSV